MQTNNPNLSLQPAGLRFPMHVYEVRPRKDKRDVKIERERA